MAFLGGFFISFTLLAQQDIVLKGIVRDKESGEAMPYATVGIYGKAIGTVTNEKGEFRLILAPYLADDSLCVSSIGYGTFKGAVRDLRKISNLDIELSPQTTVLNEIVVSGEKVTATRILEKAIERIKKNYPVKPFELDGYYRDYLKKNNDYVSLLEAAVTVQDPGFNKPESRSKVKINQIRLSPDYDENFNKYCSKAKDDTVKRILEGFSPFVNGNEFTNMKANNPIRNYNNDIPMIGSFDQFFNKNLKFDLSYKTEVNGKEIYVIKFEPSDQFRYNYVQAFGEIYIREEDYAILKFSFNYYISLFREKKKIYQLNVEYKDYNGKMFLNYLSFVNYFKIFTGDEIAELYQYREFFVNDIHYPDFTPLKQSEIIDNSVPLNKYPIKSDPDFWNHYNIVLQEQPFIN